LSAIFYFRIKYTMDIPQKINSLESEKTELQTQLFTATGERELVIRNEIAAKENLIAAYVNRLPIQAPPTGISPTNMYFTSNLTEICFKGRFPQPTGIKESSHVNAYALLFKLAYKEFSIEKAIKLDTGCSVDLVITEELKNTLHLDDELFEVICLMRITRNRNYCFIWY
jgi:hypothetical protein